MTDEYEQELEKIQQEMEARRPTTLRGAGAGGKRMDDLQDEVRKPIEIIKYSEETVFQLFKIGANHFESFLY